MRALQLVGSVPTRRQLATLSRVRRDSVDQEGGRTPEKEFPVSCTDCKEDTRPREVGREPTKPL